MTKQQTIDTLKTQLPGFYSVEQVIELISKIEESSSITPDFIEELIVKVSTAVNYTLENMDCSDVIDYDSAEFSIDYRNTLQLDRADINVDTIVDEVNSTIENKIREYFTETSNPEEDDCEC